MSNLSKWIVAASGLGAFVVVGLFGLRLVSNVSVFEPLQLQTSGFEQESLYAIWKYINDRAVYTFTTDIPFTFSNFNWLYYIFYGVVTDGVLDTFGLMDAWLPTVTRFVTVAGAVIGVLVTYKTMTRLLERQSGENVTRFLAFSLSLLVFFGPLTGFWSLTTRPDIWSTTIEAALILGFLWLYPGSAIKAALWALVLGYLAWAFKTVDITAAGGVGVFLLWRREWAAAAILAIGTLVSWTATYGLGTDAYQFSMLGAHQEISFSVDQGIRNLTNFGIKMLPVILPGIVFFVLILRQPAVRLRIDEDWQSQFLIIAALCSLGVSVLGSFKVGGAENYFFTPSLIMALLVIKVWQILGEPSWDSRASLKQFGFTIILGWLLTSAATASVIVGVNGVISQREMHERVAVMQPCLATLPQPIFVNNMNLSLPWINPSDEHFLLSFYYHTDRAGGRTFEADGIGGLIEDGYFNSLIFETPRDAFDGAALDNYVQESATCGGWTIYSKTDL